MEINKLSDDRLVSGLEQEFAVERNASRGILLHLKEISKRKIFARRGFPNLFSMLVGYFHQSESSAYQRIKALELMLDVPVVEERLTSGELNLSTVAMAQRQIRREEKLTRTKISAQKKLEIVESITGKTLAQTEVELFRHLPETACEPQNQVRRISAETTRMSLNVPDDVLEMMNRLQDIWAHVDPSMDQVEVMRRAFKLALAQVDPQARESSGKTAESEKHRGNERLTYYGKEFDRILWERARSQCQYVDDKTGRRCDCTFGLQREHCVPLAKGGTSELSNMELLCGPHNRLRAEAR